MQEQFVSFCYIFYDTRGLFGEIFKLVGACQKGFPTSFTGLPQKRGLCIRGYVYIAGVLTSWYV